MQTLVCIIYQGLNLSPHSVLPQPTSCLLICLLHSLATSSQFSMRVMKRSSGGTSVSFLIWEMILGTQRFNIQSFEQSQSCSKGGVTMFLLLIGKPFPGQLNLCARSLNVTCSVSNSSVKPQPQPS